MPALIVVGDHPSLHRGFSVVGDQIARGLQTQHQWSVDFVGFYPPAVWRQPPPYRVFDVDPPDAPEDLSGERLGKLLAELTSDVQPGQSRRLLLSIGSQQSLVLDQLEQLGLRGRVDVVAYMPTDWAPLAPPTGSLLRRVDVVVPYTAFAGRALHVVCAGQETPRVASPIPHGVDTSVFTPPTGDAREDMRRRFFGLDDGDALLVGYFGRNTGHKHPDGALEIFSAFAQGAFVRCHACWRVTPFTVDPVDGPGNAPPTCRYCGSGHVHRGPVNRAARLYLHTELPSRIERSQSGGWHLDLLADRMGISDQVVFDRSIRVGLGVDEHELARRMGACDVHLLPYDSGGWELTVLETGACGVANIITDIAAPPEYAAPFSVLVPTVARPFNTNGVRGVIDMGLAIQALFWLSRDRSERQRLGQRGVDVARTYSWARAVRAWDELLRAMSCEASPPGSV